MTVPTGRAKQFGKSVLFQPEKSSLREKDRTGAAGRLVTIRLKYNVYMCFQRECIIKCVRIITLIDN